MLRSDEDLYVKDIPEVDLDCILRQSEPNLSMSFGRGEDCVADEIVDYVVTADIALAEVEICNEDADSDLCVDKTSIPPSPTGMCSPVHSPSHQVERPDHFEKVDCCSDEVEVIRVRSKTTCYHSLLFPNGRSKPSHFHPALDHCGHTSFCCKSWGTLCPSRSRNLCEIGGDYDYSIFQWRDSLDDGSIRPETFDPQIWRKPPSPTV